MKARRRKTTTVKRRKIARAAEQSVLTEVFGFPIPATPRFIAPEHFAG